jgi:hypothetical protein
LRTGHEGTQQDGVIQAPRAGDEIVVTTGRSTDRTNPASDYEQKRAALGYLQEAWAEARLDGIDGDCLAQACLFAALAEFVSTYGEDAAATFADGLGQRIRNGEFSLEQARQ